LVVFAPTVTTTTFRRAQRMGGPTEHFRHFFQRRQQTGRAAILRVTHTQPSIAAVAPRVHTSSTDQSQRVSQTTRHTDHRWFVTKCMHGTWGVPDGGGWWVVERELLNVKETTTINKCLESSNTNKKRKQQHLQSVLFGGGAVPQPVFVSVAPSVQHAIDGDGDGMSGQRINSQQWNLFQS
jgi:hypothetical protein